jgi:L-lactate dehydrogenase complex protein LldG
MSEAADEPKLTGSAREQILGEVRRYVHGEKPLPSLEQNWIQYPDRPAQFASVLESVGGNCVRAADAAAAQTALNEIPVYRDAKQRVSLVPGIGETNIDLASIQDPHLLEPIDFAVLPGEFGVAENSAVWVRDAQVPLRALFFIVQHLALVIPADRIFDNMHQAYDALSFDRAEFGTFIAGPSKTADIEQSLVIGAHGPRSLTVFCIG